jgi:hypothetical protein
MQLFNIVKKLKLKIQKINDKHKKSLDKTILYNSIFFPIADIISSLTLGFIVLYGDKMEHTFTNFWDHTATKRKC